MSIAGIQGVTARRMWFVPELSVHGVAGWGEVDYLVLEQVGDTSSILYGSAGLGDEAQTVRFDALADHRGNQLPSTIAAPRVLIRPRGAEVAFVVGTESDNSFKVAREATTASPVIVDLLIMEMGQ
ncbi:MAG: hypothetical protein ABIE70_04485 [bacterium]